MTTSEDRTEAIREVVLQSLAEGTPLHIRGGGTKAFYGRRIGGRPLDMGGHLGVLSYEPSELVLVARAGTALREIQSLLAEQGQELPSEPPAFGEGATLGGMVAAGLSGPRRPYAGAVRDGVLGVKIINGKGEVLNFGGQVMKNVAGYDVSRLMAGALGTLGVILEVSLKLQPGPAREINLRLELAPGAAIERLSQWRLRPLPITATCHDGDCLYLRLAGGERGVRSAAEIIGGEEMADGKAFWISIREQTHAFFTQTGRLWRISVPPATPPLEIPGTSLIEWGGGVRWLSTQAPSEVIWALAMKARGHATLFLGREAGEEVFQPLTPAMLRIHQHLKHAFDPKGIFNPGRMYAAF